MKRCSLENYASIQYLLWRNASIILTTERVFVSTNTGLISFQILITITLHVGRLSYYEMRQKVVWDIYADTLQISRCHVSHCCRYFIIYYSFIIIALFSTHRYKLPLRVMSYCDVSTHRIEAPPTSDPITQSLPLQMIRIFWNITWHGKVDSLLENIDMKRLNSG